MKFGWASSLKQRVRFTPLHLAMMLADALAKLLPGSWAPPPRVALGDGICVLVPERGTPDLLAECLAAAQQALSLISERSEILVVVNGAAEAQYAELRALYQKVRWQFHTQPLGYNGAIRAGLRDISQPWVYLLNSDMRLAPDALTQLLPLRAPEIFAITSQIFFIDQTRRREETGWADGHVVGHRLEMFDREPQSPDMARGNLYPGGGSSLCQRDLLTRYVEHTHTYSPFYFEDADWGARAWAEGFEVIFCPASHAHHHHRGTVSRYFDAAEVQRVIARNALQLELRNGWTQMSATRTMSVVCDNDYRTQEELYAPALARGVFVQRLRSRRALARGFNFQRAATDHYYPRAPSARGERPRVLLVTPFSLFPPAHGGARRVSELTRRLAEHVDLILLSDERSLYGQASEPWLAPFQSVHLVEGRGDLAGESELPWPQRLKRYVYAAMQSELDRLIAVYDPDLVQIEFMELAALRPSQRGRAPLLLSLHDVYLNGSADDAAQREAMRDFAAITVCSPEDGSLLDRAGVHLVPNGASSRLASYEPSTAAPEILFMGPFRYAPNVDAICAFLRSCWPAIRERYPTARLSILGGLESAAVRDAEPLLRLPGVDLIDRFVDPAPFLARAALTINPQGEIRGSALKVIESILAGRICVSTRSGTRGFSTAPLPGLIQCDDVAAMAAPIMEYLGDTSKRHVLERADDAQVQAWTWDGIAQQQLAVYRSLIPR